MKTAVFDKAEEGGGWWRRHQPSLAAIRYGCFLKKNITRKTKEMQEVFLLSGSPWDAAHC